MADEDLTDAVVTDAPPPSDTSPAPSSEPGDTGTAATTAPASAPAAADEGAAERLRAAEAELASYRAYGKPEEIATLRDRWAQVERAAGRNDPEREAAEKEEAAADLVLRLLEKKHPGLGQKLDRLSAQEQLLLEEHTARALDVTHELMRDHDLPLDDKTKTAWEYLIDTEIRNDPALQRQFAIPTTMRQAIREGFTRASAHLNTLLQAQGARTIAEARDRKARTLAPLKPASAAPAKAAAFKSEHQPGTPGYNRDRAKWRMAQVGSVYERASNS